MLCVLFTFCCSGARMTVDARVHSALDLLAVVIAPAYRLAVDDCIARETLVVDRAEASTITVEDARRQVDAIRVVCHERRRIFDAIRTAHDAAVAAVEAGRMDEAEAMIARIRAEWSRLKGDPT